jgi:hypothetical protein
MANTDHLDKLVEAGVITYVLDGEGKPVVHLTESAWRTMTTLPTPDLPRALTAPLSHPSTRQRRRMRNESA